MKLSPITSLAVACAALMFCGAFTPVSRSQSSESRSRRYPTVVSCSLTMIKSDTNTPDAFEQFPYSCNDFSVQNNDEYQFVEVGCRFAQVLQRTAFKVENAPCQASRAYAKCRVILDDQPTDPVDTYYFLSKDSSSGRDAQEELFRNSCATLGGEFLK